MANYLERGTLGYRGRHTDSTKNLVVDKINKLVDEHNSKINSFPSEAENDFFYKKISLKISRLERILNSMCNDEIKR